MSDHQFTMNLRNIDTDLPESRDAVIGIARGAGFSDEAVWDISTAVFEACANALTHGSKGTSDRVCLSIRLHHGCLEAQVRDSGTGCSRAPGEYKLTPMSKRGRGIALMNSVMDEVDFQTDDGFKVTLTKYLK